MMANLQGKANFTILRNKRVACRGLPNRDLARWVYPGTDVMVIAGKFWWVVLTLCGASVVAMVAVAQQAATEAPTGFDTPTLVENPGSQSLSNGIAEPPGDSFVLDQQVYETTNDVNSGLGPAFY